MTNHTLMDTIRLYYNNLSKSETKVADYILKSTNDITHLTLSEFSDIIGVSEPTIIRFTKSIHIKGFTELKLQAMKDLGSQNNTSSDQFYLHNFDISKDDDVKDLPAIIYNKTIKSLKDTIKILDSKDYQHIITCIINARIIEIVAVGNSGAVALDLMSKLSRIGIAARYTPDNHLQDLNIQGMGPNDLVFAISHSGSTTDIVKSLKLAQSLNIPTIALTNFKSSVIKDYADTLLYTGDNETTFLSETMSSRISQLMIIDMIYSAIIISNYDKYSKHLEMINTAVEKKNTK